MAQAFQCDKCKAFEIGEPSQIIIHRRDVIGSEEVKGTKEKDVCHKCLEEIENLFPKDKQKMI